MEQISSESSKLSPKQIFRFFNPIWHDLFRASKKQGRRGHFSPLILTFVLKQQWCSNLLISFTNCSRVHKLFRSINQPRLLDLWRHSLPYMVKILFCLFRRRKASSWRHEHVLIVLIINVKYVAMFQENTNKWFFVCATNSRNIIPLFHKMVISQEPRQNNYLSFARTCKTKFYGSKIKLNRLKLLQNFLLWHNW